MTPHSRKSSAGDAGNNPRLDRLLRAYATAATATGVSLLALASVSEAKIVYTPANKPLAPNHRIPLDLNHDGQHDFVFSDTAGATSFGGGWGFLTIFPTRVANRIWGSKTADRGFLRYASALSAGVLVGPKGKFTPGNKVMADTSLNEGIPRRRSFSSYCYGPWKNVTDRYLGFKFLVKNTVHYGWARVDVSCSDLTVSGTLTGYAYETVPKKAIMTGKKKSALHLLSPAQTKTLGALAAGKPVRGTP